MAERASRPTVPTKRSTGKARPASFRMPVVAWVALAVVLTLLILVPAGVVAVILYRSLMPTAPVAALPPPAPAKQPAPPRPGQPPAAKPDPPAQPAQPPAGQPGPAPGAPPAVAPPQRDIEPQGAGAFVFMEPVEPPPQEIALDIHQGVLMRELARQSLLLAAREELGLYTRDALLGETPPTGMPDVNRLSVSSVFQSNKGMRFRMTYGPKQAAQQVWDAKAPLGKLDYVPILMLMELHSRTSIAGELKKALGVGKSNRYRPTDFAPPAEVAALLSDMTIAAQYQAVHLAHAHIRAKGEAPGSLGALVRAYANLSLLTEFQWDGASRICRARSWLYAARLLNKLPKDSPYGYWHFAYAGALAGHHSMALTALRDAEPREQTRAKQPEAAANLGPPPPPWVELIAAYCRCDVARLKQPADDPALRPLAEVLWYCSVENVTCPLLSVTTGLTVLKSNPECYRVYDGICRLGSLGDRQAGTLRAMAVFAEQFPRRLAALPGLPAAVANLAQQGPPGPELWRALRDAGNSPAEPREFSWAVLGHFARETHFAQVCQRLDFMKNMWYVPTAEYANQVLPSVAGHPYEPFVRTFTIDRMREVGACRALLAQLPETVLPTQVGLLGAYAECKAPTEQRVAQLGMLQYDAVDYDLRLMLVWATAHQHSYVPTLTQMLMGASPFSPLGRGRLVQNSWQKASAQAEAWEKEAQHPVLLLYLGEHYLNAGQHKDALRCLEKALALSPELEAYRLVADAYKATGALDKWQASLDRFLEQPNTGLEHAKVRVQIANELMARHLWQRAQPYADAAAQTGADWAMDCASKCCAGLGQWDKSEQWIRRCTDRYENSFWKWYFWCKRYDRGDQAGAAKVITDRFQDIAQIAAPVDLLNMGFYYTLADRPEQAMAVFKALKRMWPDGDVTTLLLVLAHDENEQFDLRDKLLKNFPQGTGKSPLLWLPLWYREALARGEKARPDFAVADKHLKELKRNQIPCGAYLVARFLEQHGHRKEAIHYYRICISIPQPTHEFWPTAATVRLRALGVAPEPLQPKADL